METREYRKTGTWHLDHHQSCQDQILFAENNYMAAAVIADGVSACTHSDKGAEITCQAVIDFLMNVNVFQQEYCEEKLGYLLNEYIMYCLEKKASEEQACIDEYASTVSLIYLDKERKKAAALKLGDSPLYRLNGNRFEKAVHDYCRYVQPYLTTDTDAWKHMNIRYFDYEPADSFFLCTDGFSDSTKNIGLKKTRTLIQTGDFERLNDLLDQEDNRDDLSYIVISDVA